MSVAKKDITLPDVPAPGSDRVTWIRFAVTVATIIVTAVLTYMAQKPPTVVVQPQVHVVQPVGAQGGSALCVPGDGEGDGAEFEGFVRLYRVPGK
jgi:hypothetical protein